MGYCGTLWTLLSDHCATELHPHIMSVTSWDLTPINWLPSHQLILFPHNSCDLLVLYCLSLSWKIMHQALSTPHPVLLAAMTGNPPMSIPHTTDAFYPQICCAKLNTHWPASETPFDHAMGEFSKWSTKLEIFLQQSSLNQYIFGPMTKPNHLILQPNSKTEANVYANWLSNNNLIISVIQAAVSDAEQEGLVMDGTAKECYNALKSWAHCKGLLKQVTLIHKALSTYIPVLEPIETTAWKICKLVD